MIKNLEVNLYLGSKISSYLEKNSIQSIESGNSCIYKFNEQNCITTKDVTDKRNKRRLSIKISDTHPHYKNIEKMVSSKEEKN